MSKDSLPLHRPTNLISLFLLPNAVMSPVVLQSPSQMSDILRSSPRIQPYASGPATQSLLQSQASLLSSSNDHHSPPPARQPQQQQSQQQQQPSAPSPAPAATNPAGRTPCVNCGTLETPLWRRDADGNPICNACGEHLFEQLSQLSRIFVRPRTRVFAVHQPSRGVLAHWLIAGPSLLALACPFIICTHHITYPLLSHMSASAPSRFD